MPQNGRTPFHELPAAQKAGMLCNDPRFQRFAAIRCGLPGDAFNPSAAAEYLRNCCHVQSRRALNSDGAAAKRFQALLTEFDAWTGRIATPR